MKVALILNGNIWYSPYVNIYTRMLDEMNVEYDIISWNRDGRDEKQGIQFIETLKKKDKLTKMRLYLSYVSFIKNTLRDENYDKLIVFGPQLAIFLSGFLKKYYNGNYILDYRDLSIEQKWYFRPFMRKALKYSYANVVSSPGFIKCLSRGFKYLLSHNFDINAVRTALNNTESTTINTKHFNVLTIGGIRDFSSNIEVVKGLANKSDFTLQFVGKSFITEQLESFARENKVKNLEIEGFYPKEKESEYILNASVLNIFYPVIITHSTALSNRFYNALIFKRPMIVTANSTQGDYVEKYQLGLALTDCNNLDEKIKNWFKTTDYTAFCQRCNDLLKEFLNDYNEVESMLKKLVGK